MRSLGGVAPFLPSAEAGTRHGTAAAAPAAARPRRRNSLRDCREISDMMLSKELCAARKMPPWLHPEPTGRFLVGGTSSRQTPARHLIGRSPNHGGSSLLRGLVSIHVHIRPSYQAAIPHVQRPEKICVLWQRCDARGDVIDKAKNCKEDCTDRIPIGSAHPLDEGNLMNGTTRALRVVLAAAAVCLAWLPCSPRGGGRSAAVLWLRRHGACGTPAVLPAQRNADQAVHHLRSGRQEPVGFLQSLRGKRRVRLLRRDWPWVPLPPADECLLEIHQVSQREGPHPLLLRR